MTTKFEIGQEVVRTKGDYVVGRTGRILDLDLTKGRAQVQWGTKSWVSFNSIELISIPYKIIPSHTNKKGNFVYPKYIKL